MLLIERRTAATAPGDDARDATRTRWRGSVLLPAVLAVILSVAAVWLSPTAAWCGHLEDFPCGP